MGRSLKFAIVKCVRGGSVRWRIRVPARFSSTGRSSDLFYESKRAARLDQIELLRRFSQGELLGADLLSADQVHEAQEAFRLLDELDSPLGLVEAVKLAIASFKAQLRAVSVAELLERYVADASAARHWSDAYRGSWRFYSSQFISAFGSRNIATVLAPELREWFAASYASATYYNSALGVLAPAFSWAVKQEMLDRSPFLLIERRKVIAADGVDVFSVDEARALLDACSGEFADARLAFAVLLFAGIRPEELTKITWQDVFEDSTGMFIRVRPTVAKTRQVRNVRVRPNLRSILLSVPAEERVGKLIPTNWKRKAFAIRERAHCKGRSNAARHSFASYSLAMDGNIDAVRADMGHARGSDMLFKHYRAAVTREQALLYWELGS